MRAIEQMEYNAQIFDSNKDAELAELNVVPVLGPAERDDVYLSGVEFEIVDLFV